MRSSHEIMQELEAIRQDINEITSNENVLLTYDFKFHVAMITDLKRELRLALIEERQ